MTYVALPGWCLRLVSPGPYEEPGKCHHIRALLTSRKAVLRRHTDLENEIRKLLKTFGMQLPSTLGHRRFAETVRPIIEVDANLTFALLPMLEAQAVLLKSYQLRDKRVKPVATQDPVCMLLMTAPGVGAVTALHFKAAMDDPSRLTSSRLVSAYFGLTPRRFQSDESDNQGRISKAVHPAAKHFTAARIRAF